MTDHAETIARRNRRRFFYALLTFAAYLVFAAQYLPVMSFMGEAIAGFEPVTYAIGWFCFLIVLFVTLEWRFIRTREGEDEHV